jgi:hypothetical protein
MSKQMKLGVERGGGPPPGYRWNVFLPSPAFEDARKFLNDDQYQHLAMQVKELARQVDPTHPLGLDVDAIENFHELRDKGGVLGGMNVRVFFYVDKSRKAVVILGAIRKQNDGPTPKGDRSRMARRLRTYLAGGFPGP